MSNLSQILSSLGQKRQKKWTEQIQELLDQLNEIDKKPKDRLGYARAISALLAALNFSLKGWTQWFSSIATLESISEEDYKQLYEEMKPHIFALLELDKRVTKKREDEIEREERKKKKKKGKKNGKGEYVA